MDHIGRLNLINCLDFDVANQRPQQHQQLTQGQLDCRALKQMLDTQTLVDCTLACNGGKISAHKVVLSACSSYLAKILHDHPVEHPIIILPELSIDDVRTLVHYMYTGELLRPNSSNGSLSAASSSISLLRTAAILSINSLHDLFTVNGNQAMTRTATAAMTTSTEAAALALQQHQFQTHTSSLLQYSTLFPALYNQPNKSPSQERAFLNPCITGNYVSSAGSELADTRLGAMGSNLMGLNGAANFSALSYASQLGSPATGTLASAKSLSSSTSSTSSLSSSHSFSSSPQHHKQSARSRSSTTGTKNGTNVVEQLAHVETKRPDHYSNTDLSIRMSASSPLTSAILIGSSNPSVMPTNGPFPGEFQFKCPVCHNNFQTICSFEYHMQRIHQVTSFGCEICHKPFASLRYVLTDHMRRCHGIKGCDDLTAAAAAAAAAAGANATPPVLSRVSTVPLSTIASSLTETGRWSSATHQVPPL